MVGDLPNLTPDMVAVLTSQEELPPIMRSHKWAEKVGDTDRQVQKRVNEGELPVVTFGLEEGKRGVNYINVEKLKQICREQKFNHPVLGEF